MQYIREGRLENRVWETSLERKKDKNEFVFLWEVGNIVAYMEIQLPIL